MDFLADLNPQQKKAVTAGLGPVLVLAGPGSGKTRVLTQRIAYLVGSMGVRPYNLLAVTFTNKAAREMGNRVVELLGEVGQGLTLGTFHSACVRILRREAAHLPFNSNFVIFDSDDQKNLIKRALEDLNLDTKQYRPESVHASISNAKNELLLPEDYPLNTYRDEVVRRVYERYQALLLENNGVDFDDLLLWTARLLGDHPVVRETYARRYEHVLVDEFQDTNLAQYTLLRHLASYHHNLFVVGDTDQSIYAWRGADYRNVLRFEGDYPDTKVILLEQNYRSTQTILDVAMAVIDRNPHRSPKRLFTERGPGKKITLHQTYDDREEAAYVIDTIANLVARQLAQPGDFAIMYRTNAQSRLLEEGFLHAGLPYKLVGAQRFYGRREIKDVVAFLRLVQNVNDEVSSLRVINVPTRGIGNKTVLALRTQAQAAGMRLGELLLDLARGEKSLHSDEFVGRAAGALADFGTLLARWQAWRTELSPLALMDHILEDVRYREYIDDGTDEGRERWENVMELRRVAAEYQDRSLENFLEDVALVSDQDTLEASTNVPTLLTLHAAKGLEFPYVFIVGLNDGTLPHIRSFDDPDGMEEERRLFYVGITRAMDQLSLVVPLNRNAYGYSEPVDESRFVKDIPADLLDGSGLVRQRGRTNPGYRPDRWETQMPGATRVLQPLYSPGARVAHPVWGEGMVLNSRIQDDDEIVDIFFEQVGLKRVAASLAKLQVKT
ncbi:MAG TPA: UvrD-helicase domain-containing protein [Anaerolineales bacterium]|nr:UvrD-helicase domain-containing protein [Anaerolineales bacterium]